MKVLSSQETAHVGGAETVGGCTYGGNFYSYGATVSVGPGLYQTCMQSGGNYNFGYWGAVF
jgi:hypothetical protein